MTEPIGRVKSGIHGLDEITGGGLPQGRPTLLCGGAGSGKTLLAMSFLAEGALRHGEPGVFICFEETEEELGRNFASLGYDLETLIADKKLAIDFIQLERSEIEETGEYDLEGLFVRIACAIDAVGAKRVALDTIEALFAGLSDAAILRSELRRLFRWLKDRGMSAVITAERGEGALTRHGLEEYVSDCVILLDHRVENQIATRRLRIVKYRGGAHGANEYPFLIDSRGISVLPVTSLELAHDVSTERVGSGIQGLDEMLGGQGFWRGSSVLVSGGAGTGKTTIAAQFVVEACRRGERALFFAFEESPQQVARNMRAVGVDLQRWIDAGSLRFIATRPTFWGLEMHLARMHREVEDFSPQIVAIDPLFSLGGDNDQVKSMLLRLIDYLKGRRISAMCTAILHEAAGRADHIGVSSLMDAWIELRSIESSGEINRGIRVIKARGIAHSNQIREFVVTDAGVALRSPYLGSGGVLSGSARLAREMADHEAKAERELTIAAGKQAIEAKRRRVAAQIAALEAELADEETKAELFLARQRNYGEASDRLRSDLINSRGGLNDR